MAITGFELGGNVSQATVVVYPDETVGTFLDAWSPTDPGLEGWFYGDIRQAGTMGATTTYDRTSSEASIVAPGTSGSLEINLTSGADKAGFNQYFTTPFPLSDLEGAGYDWYRDSLSTNPTQQAPALFFQFDADGNLGTADTIEIKYEPIYNGVGPSMPVNSWQTAVINDTTHLWSWNAPGDEFVFDLDLNDWKTKYPNAVVTWMGVDAGSGWNGIFSGAVDSVVVDRSGTANDQCCRE